MGRSDQRPPGHQQAAKSRSQSGLRSKQTQHTGQARSRSHQPDESITRFSDVDEARRALSPGFDFGSLEYRAAGVASGKNIVGREHMRFTPCTLHRNILKVPDEAPASCAWDTE